MQEQWLQTINDLIMAIPLGSDDDLAKEAERHMAIQRLRKAIAFRWNHLYNLKSQLPEPEWDTLCGEVQACMATIVEQNALDDIPFAPDMKDIFPVGQSDRIPITNDASSPSDKSSSVASSRSCIPHEFRWLEMSQGVWTVMKALL